MSRLLKRLERVRAWRRRGRIRAARHDEKAPRKRLAGQKQAEPRSKAVVEALFPAVGLNRSRSEGENKGRPESVEVALIQPDLFQRVFGQRTTRIDSVSSRCAYPTFSPGVSGVL
jgi:hypothetical protein